MANKYQYVSIVQGNYGFGHGWEDLTCCETRPDAIAERKTYDENENYPHRVITRRVLNPAHTTTDKG